MLNQPRRVAAGEHRAIVRRTLIEEEEADLRLAVLYRCFDMAEVRNRPAGNALPHQVGLTGDDRVAQCPGDHPIFQAFVHHLPHHIGLAAAQGDAEDVEIPRQGPHVSAAAQAVQHRVDARLVRGGGEAEVRIACPLVDQDAAELARPSAALRQPKELPAAVARGHASPRFQEELRHLAVLVANRFLERAVDGRPRIAAEAQQQNDHRHVVVQRRRRQRARVAEIDLLVGPVAQGAARRLDVLQLDRQEERLPRADRLRLADQDLVAERLLSLLGRQRGGTQKAGAEKDEKAAGHRPSKYHKAKANGTTATSPGAAVSSPPQSRHDGLAKPRLVR